MEIKINIVGLDQLTESLALIGSAMAYQRGMVNTAEAAVSLLMEVSDTVGGHKEEVKEVKEVKEVEEVEEVSVKEEIKEVASVEESKERESVITIEDVRAAFMAKNSKGNTPKLKDILKEFNVAKVTDLEEKDFEGVLARLEAI